MIIGPSENNSGKLFGRRKKRSTSFNVMVLV